jgi:hypothetical protein
MFVRWQSQTRQRLDIGHYGPAAVEPDVYWTAELVESVRVKGQRRQRHIASLASISESHLEADQQCRYFWDAVHERLDRLGNLISIDDRRRIEAAIALKVPRLSREEHEASVEKVRQNLPETEHKPYRSPT